MSIMAILIFFSLLLDLRTLLSKYINMYACIKKSKPHKNQFICEDSFADYLYPFAQAMLFTTTLVFDLLSNIELL